MPVPMNKEEVPRALGMENYMASSTTYDAAIEKV